jgi:polyhydroxybutyrate depolymerase
MGTKDPQCADSRCGAWSYVREYFVHLPATYDRTKAYPLVLEGPGCGGKGDNVYTLPSFDANVIRVGLTPSADAQAFHSTNPGQGCFDDKEGDDSVDFVFYEDLWDLLATQVCFDTNRVFASGNSSGAWLANELGCKYAGDATRPIRGVLVNNGGLPTDARYVPTCTKSPLAGLFIQNLDLTSSTGFQSVVAINRALLVNDCQPTGETYSTGMTDPYPIGGGLADTTCKKIQGCPALFPVVVCAINNTAHASNPDVVGAAWPTFLQALAP